MSTVRLLLVIGAAVVLTSSACAGEHAGDARDTSAAARGATDPRALFHAQLGRTWELARLGEHRLPPSRAGSATRTPGQDPGPGSRPTIRFTSDPPGALSPDTTLSRAGGRSFCNGWGTAYRVGPGDSLRFHGFESTLVGCDGADSLETRFFRTLAATRRFALDADTLVLVAGDGSRLTFVAVGDSVDASRE